MRLALIILAAWTVLGTVCACVLGLLLKRQAQMAYRHWRVMQEMHEAMREDVWHR